MGFFAFCFSQKVKYAIGVDYEISSLLIAKKYSEQRNIKNAFFVQADALALPFKEGVFSKVTNIDFIEHIIPNNQNKVVKEMVHVLKHRAFFYLYSKSYKTQARILH